MYIYIYRYCHPKRIDPVIRTHRNSGVVFHIKGMGLLSNHAGQPFMHQLRHNSTPDDRPNIYKPYGKKKGGSQSQRPFVFHILCGITMCVYIYICIVWDMHLEPAFTAGMI